MKWPAASRGLVSLGATSTLAQVVLLRESMSTLAGSELAWGLVLSMWLLGVAVGARLGARSTTFSHVHFLPPIVVMAAFFGSLILRCAPSLMRSNTGELISLFQAGVTWIAAVLPCALLSGFAFPILARRHGAASTAYALEAVGALAGGLGFSLVFAPLGTAITLGTALALALVTFPTSGKLALKTVSALLILLCATVVEEHFLVLTWHFAGHPGHLSRTRETRQQRLEMTAGVPAALYGNGTLLASYPESYAVAGPTHLALLLSPSPQRVLALGTLADGSFEHILRHPVQVVQLVETDPALGRVLPAWFGRDYARRLSDPRVQLHDRGVSRVLSDAGPVDLILLSGPPPTSLRVNHIYTVEFFERCYSQLAPRGVLVVRTGQKDTYLGGESGALLATLNSTLQDVFHNVVALPADEILLLASRDPRVRLPAPYELQERWRERGIQDSSFHPAMIPILVDPERSAALNDDLRTSPRPANSARRPTAILPAIALNEGITSRSLHRLLRVTARLDRTPLLVVLVCGALGFLVLVRRSSSSNPTLAATIGASSMCWWFLLLAGWQSTQGTVYAEIGALNALFMAGLASGGFLAHRGLVSPHALPTIFGAAALLSLLIALGLGFLLVPLSVPVLLTAGGALCGLSFPLLVECSRKRHPSSAIGRIYAAEEVGAALAALGLGVFALPTIGISGCAWTLTGVLSISALCSWLQGVHRSQ